MTSDSHKREEQPGKATRTSVRRSSVSARTPPRRTSPPQAPFPRRLALEQLEPRLLLSADGFGLAPELALPAAPLTATATIAPAATESTHAAVAATRELVFIDPRVPDARELLAALVGDADPSRQFEVITLDPQRDGLAQVTAALKGRMQLDAVHFITHGSDGAIQLGGTLLDAKALAANQDLVSAWSGALKDGADLLFYGCDLAASARGRALVDWIADLTGADVAASTDKTGSAAQGGDWVLEYKHGIVDTQIAVGADEQSAWNHLLASVVVTTTNDTVNGDTSSIANLIASPGADGISLREAITAANLTSGADTIAFNLLTSDPRYSSGTGVWTINVGSALPNISDSVLIDGWSQLGWADKPLIELNGAATNPNTDGLVFTDGDSEVRGLIINRFGVGGGGGNGGSGIIADNNAKLVIRGNYIGTDATGNLPAGNGDWGVWLRSDNNIVGGPTDIDRNVISGNGQDGIWIDGSTGNVVGGNYIGTNRDGTASIGNAYTGIWINNASGNTIGGPSPANRNVISGNGFASNWQGVLLQNSKNNVVQGNYIGTDALGTAAIGNAGPGIELYGGANNNLVSGNVVSGNTLDGIVIYQSDSNAIKSNIIGATFDGTGSLGNGDNGVWITGSARNNMIGGPNPGDGNVITANGFRLSASGYYLAGVEVDGNGSTSNAILGNRIYGNTGLGIDLNVLNSSGLGDGVTANDTGDGDGGPNLRQNFPVLGPATTSGSKVQVTVSLNSTANTTFRIEVFASGAADTPSGYGEGARYLGAFSVTTDNTGNVTNFRWILNASVTPGEAISATATVDLGSGNFGDTSEFSRTVPAVNNDPPTVNTVTASGLEDASAIPVTLVGTDLEGPIASFRLVSLTANGALYTDAGLTIAAATGIDYLAATNTLTLYFKPAANWNGTTGFQFTASDLLGALAVVPADATINVASVNDAPVLAGAIGLDAINEDPTSNPGTPVSALIAGQVGDSDAGALTGIAVTAVDNTNGSWEYSLNNGSTWNAFGSPSATAARLLAADADTFVRFVPNPDWNGTVTNGITFHAWDQTNGAPGGTAVLTTSQSVLDNFSVVSYNSNDGTAAWATSWVETDSAGGGATSGEVRVTAGSLRLHPAVNGDSIYREVNLTGASNATLTFDYTNSLGAVDQVDLQISNDGGSSYSTLAAFSSASNTGSGAMSFDISAYIAANTRVRFVVVANGDNQYLYVDNIEIAYVTPSTGGSTAFSTASANGGITVNPVNDAPAVNNLDGDAIALVEGAPATIIDQSTAATVIDVDSTDFDGGTLTVSFTAGNSAAEDVLALRDQGISVGQIGVSGANVTYNFGSGAVNIGTVSGGTGGASLVVTLNANATPTVVQALIRNVTYLNVDTATPTPGVRSVQFVLTDGDGGASTPVMTTVTMSDVNDPPSATIVQSNYTATEQVDLTLAGTGLSVADVDAGSSNVTVKLAVVSGTVEATAGTTSVGVAITGFGSSVVTLTGSVAEINELLAGNGGATVTYRMTSDSPPTIDTLTLSINDNGNTGSGGPLSAADSVTIAINPVNDPPLNTLPSAATMPEDTPLVFNAVLGKQISVTDVDGAGGNLSVSLNATNGVLTLTTTAGLAFTSGDGTADGAMAFSGTQAAVDAALDGLIFMPDLNFYGTALLSLTSTDQGGATDSDLTTITVTPVNDAPVGTDETAVTPEDVPYAPSVADFGFTDVDFGDSMSAVRIDTIALPTGATLLLSGVPVVPTQTILVADLAAGNLVFTPATNANGMGYGTLTFSVRDQAGAYDSTPRTLNLDVMPVNDAPLITSAAAATTAENSKAVTTVTATDIDSLPTGFVYSIAGGPDAGYFTIDPTTGVLAFAAGPNFEAPADAGADNVYDVTVQVDDGDGGIATRSIAVTVMDINDAPVAADDGYVTIENTPLSVPAASLFANDYDEDGSPLAATLVSGPANGTLTLNVDGSFVYTPGANFSGTDSFRYRVSDGTLVSSVAAVTITVSPANLPPTSADGSVNTDEGVTYAFTLADFNYDDADGDPLDHIQITSLPTAGTLLLNGNPVAINDIVTRAEIAAGSLTYAPPASVSSPLAEQFGFRVHDGTQYQSGGQIMTVGVAPLAIAAPPPPSGGGGGSTPPSSTGGSGGSGSGGGSSSGAGSGSAGGEPAPAVGGHGSSGAESAAATAAPEAPAQEPAKLQSTESAATLAAPSVADSSMTVRAGGVTVSGTDTGLGTPAVSEATKHEKAAEEAAVAAISAPEFKQELDRLRQESKEDATTETRVAGTVFAASTSLSVGYVIWLLRGGVLLSSLLSSLPAWRLVDPLPVLARLSDGEDDEDDDSLEELVERSADHDEYDGDGEHDGDDAHEPAEAGAHEPAARAAARRK